MSDVNVDICMKENILLVDVHNAKEDLGKNQIVKTLIIFLSFHVEEIQ